MKNKQEICVHIRNEKELQQAREILERNGEKIDEFTFILTSKKLNYLKFNCNTKDWYLGGIRGTEIPLSELEAVLLGESEAENKSSIEWLLSLLKTDEEKEQAKQMHRQEIEDAYDEGFEDVFRKGHFYYENTFKND